MKRIIPVIALVIFLAGTPAWAADATAALDINSAYSWRGITFNDGLVLQPSLDVTKGGFGVNVWGNYDISDYDDTLDANNFSEVDITLSYGMEIGNLSLGAGLIEYLFPATPKTAANGTREIFVSAGYAILEGLSAGVNLYYDTDEIHGYYGDLNVAYTMQIMEQLSIEAGAKVGFADEEFAEAYGGEDGGWYDYGFSLGATYALSDVLSVGAKISYVGTMDEDVLLNEAADTNLFGGVSASYAF